MQKTPKSVTIVYSKLCPHCQELIDKVVAQGNKEKGGKDVKLVNLDTKEGEELLKKHGFSEVPVAVSGSGITCEIQYVNGEVEVVCPEVEENS
jgi:hypothetical protein